MSSSLEADQAIDELLERYLGLVDRYTTLREDLARAQQAMFHALARANFTSDRGARYGQDQFDERMQASRRVVVTMTTTAASPSQTSSWAAAASSSPPPTFTMAEEEEEPAAAAAAAAAENDDDGRGAAREGGKKQPPPPLARNPIRWFGVLVPQALRDAQSHAVSAVQHILPRLASVQAEMAHVEIEVRRARKRRAKAAAAAAAAAGGSSSSSSGKKQHVVTGTADAQVILASF